MLLFLMFHQRRVVTANYALIYTAASAKHLVILIRSGLIFQWELFAHGKIIHFFHIHDAFKIGMTFKNNAIEIISFSFLPVGGFKKNSSRIDFWFVDIYKTFKPKAYIVYQVVQMVYNGQFPAFVIWIMYHGNIG